MSVYYLYNVLILIIQSGHGLVVVPSMQKKFTLCENQQQV